MKRLFGPLALGLATLLAACGGGSASPASSPAAPATSTAAAPASAAGGASAKPAGSGATASAAASGAASADSLDAVKAEAQKNGGKVVWYESIEQDQGEKVLEAFKQDYPFMTGAKFVSVVSGNRVAKVTQESMAKGPTADVDFGNAATLSNFYNQGFVNTVDWQALGVKTSPELTPTNYMVAVTAPYYVILYNTQKVSEADAPKSLQDLMDPKWKGGRIGLWARPQVFVTMAATWGEQQTVDFVTKLSKTQKPKIYDSNFTIAQDVGAGNIDVAVTTYHTTLPTQQKGAPVKVVTLDPTPINPLYGYSLKYGQNPAGGKLLLSWLAGPKGAKVYEDVSGRGNPFLEETKTGQMLKSVKTIDWPIDTQIKQADMLNNLEAQLTKIQKEQ
ncbi:MAG TPA: ABC transporter substrate-binding protein [Chloroflexota bacterium]|nr:ABC transporter substrate-binding protein [Chloroflexota bacterium]